ncbi:MAG: hypothetical protein AAGJ34_09755 [Pseudomonadota bacterium]
MNKKSWHDGFKWGLISSFVLALPILALLFLSGETFWGWLIDYADPGDTSAQVLMAIASVAAAIFLLFTLWVTQEMASQTRRMGEAQTRAYIAASYVLASPKLTEDASVSHLSFRVGLKNTGLTPAKIVRLNLAATLAQPHLKFEDKSERIDGSTEIPVGSGENITTVSADFPLEKLNSAVEDGAGLILFVHCEYEDVFFEKNGSKELNIAKFRGYVPITPKVLKLKEPEGKRVDFTYMTPLGS